MKKVPYSSLTLVPWSDLNTTILDFVTIRGFCIKKIHDTLVSRAMEYKNEFDSELPEKSNTFYFVPLDSEKEAFENHGLKFASFAALFLPSISLIDWVVLPEDIKNGTIIAKDETFSCFLENQYLLAADLSKGGKNLVFIEKQTRSRLLQKKFFLAEKA